MFEFIGVLIVYSLIGLAFLVTLAYFDSKKVKKMVFSLKFFFILSAVQFIALMVNFGDCGDSSGSGIFLERILGFIDRLGQNFFQISQCNYSNFIGSDYFYYLWPITLLAYVSLFLGFLFHSFYVSLKESKQDKQKNNVELEAEAFQESKIHTKQVYFLQIILGIILPFLIMFIMSMAGLFIPDRFQVYNQPLRNGLQEHIVFTGVYLVAGFILCLIFVRKYKVFVSIFVILIILASITSSVSYVLKKVSRDNFFAEYNSQQNKQVANNTVSTATWETYEDINYGVSFHYPLGWTVEKQFSPLSPQSDKTDGFRVYNKENTSNSIQIDHTDMDCETLVQKGFRCTMVDGHIIFAGQDDNPLWAFNEIISTIKFTK